MAKYAKQLEQVLDLMLKADARKVQIKEGKLPVDIKDDKQFRQFTAEARELTRNILVTMSRDILSEQDIADLSAATDELEDTDVTAGTGDEASDRIEDEERGFTDDGTTVDDVGGDEFGGDEGAEGGDEVSDIVDSLLDLVSPEEAKGLIDDAGGGAEGAEGGDLDEFANVDDTSIDAGAEDDLNLDDILAGLGDDASAADEVDAAVDDEDGDEDGAEEDDAAFGDEGGEDGEDEGEGAGDEPADSDNDDAEDEGGEEEEEAPVSESIRSRTRVTRRGK